MTDILLMACENAKGMEGTSAAECERFSSMLRTSIGANVMASEEQIATTKRFATPAETAAAKIQWLAIGSYARLLAERRITLDAFHHAVAQILAVSTRFPSYPG
jgi:hypothetical protein